ncbi:peroxiredoxin [Acidipila sp. EB88]|uniref:peroxiredoxin n=1 Tax=Acidipila sp. EB88 TaxID=2305226 RepID=UPI000F5F29F3|nr:peroxiredoxin [Acidipila sp. EB88]RRA47932.1 peroxiredoxin [Acidipila sp. EB88]
MQKLPLAVASLALLLGLGWAGDRALAARAAAADTDTLPMVGQKAPTFTLPSQTGTPTSLASFHGKWVVLYFYPKDGTSGCTLEAHNFQQDAPKYEKMNAVIVGVSVDTVDSHKEFCAKEGLNFHLLADPDKKVVTEYGSLGNMMGFKIAKRNTFLISPDGKIVKVWTGVNPSSHSSEVLAELQTDAHKG